MTRAHIALVAVFLIAAPAAVKAVSNAAHAAVNYQPMEK